MEKSFRGRNNRRVALILKRKAEPLSEAEEKELAELQVWCRTWADRHYPKPQDGGE